MNAEDKNLDEDNDDEKEKTNFVIKDVSEIEKGRNLVKVN